MLPDLKTLRGFANTWIAFSLINNNNYKYAIC